MGEVQLRPVRLEDLDVFDRSFASVEGAGEHQWFGFTPSHAVRQVFHERGLLGGPHNMASVTVDGELAGRVEWLQRRWGRRDTSACWEIAAGMLRSEEHTSELQSRRDLVCRLLLEKKKKKQKQATRKYKKRGHRTSTH